MSKQTRKRRKIKKNICIYIIAIICIGILYVATEKLENKTEKNNINEITNNRNKLKYRYREYIHIKKHTSIYRKCSS